MTVHTIPPPPVMTAGFLRDQITPVFAQSRRFLDAVAAHGSPLFLVDSPELVDQAGRFRTAFESRLPATRFYFAMKSNSMPEISRILTAKGFGLDVSSGLELTAALEMDTDHIIFSGPGKTGDELMLAAAHPNRVTLLMDSIGECRRLMAVLTGKNSACLPACGSTASPRGCGKNSGSCRTS